MCIRDSADVAGADHEHAKTALSDAAADGKGQLVLKQDVYKRQKLRRTVRREGDSMIFERTVAEIAGDYAVLVSESGTRTEVALSLIHI